MVTDIETSGGRRSLKFDMYFEGRMVAVRVEAGESDYGVHFDGQLVDVIEQHETDEWEGQTGYLDEDVLQQIGSRIAGYFEPD